MFLRYNRWYKVCIIGVNTMIDLRNIINNNPDVLDNRSSLRNALIPLYPNKLKYINAVLDIFECGIADQIMVSTTLSRLNIDHYISRLVNEYGLQDNVAYDGILIWASAYNIKLDLYSGTTVTTDEEVSLYDIEKNDQGYFIKKYKGFDEPKVIIPHIIGEYKIVGISESAYAGCVSIEELIITNGIQYIENNAFRGCKNIKRISLPHTLVSLGDFDDKPCTGVFMDTQIESVSLPYGLQHIGNYAFFRCYKLKEIILPDTVLKIGVHIFGRCEKLNKIKLSSKLKSIPEGAFEQCSSLEKIIIPNGVETIEASAFNMSYVHQNKLASVLIPPSVKK